MSEYEAVTTAGERRVDRAVNALIGVGVAGAVTSVAASLTTTVWLDVATVLLIGAFVALGVAAVVLAVRLGLAARAWDAGFSAGMEDQDRFQLGGDPHPAVQNPHRSQERNG